MMPNQTTLGSGPAFDAGGALPSAERLRKCEHGQGRQHDRFECMTRLPPSLQSVDAARQRHGETPVRFRRLRTTMGLRCALLFHADAQRGPAARPPGMQHRQQD